MPTDRYMAEIAAQFEWLDELPEWQIELVWEYGLRAAMEAMRYGKPPAATRALLEKDRLAKELLRWGLHSR